MTIKVELILPAPGDGPYVTPREMYEVSPEMRAAFEKARWRWGIHNHLVKTMAAMPQLGLTEVDYADSFIFDEGTWIDWPRPGILDQTVKFPTAGFIDRVTKELTISLVSLLNRSRYSITHHSVIGYAALVDIFQRQKQVDPQGLAEQKLLRIVDAQGNTTFENQTWNGEPLYSEFEIACLRFAVKARANAHSVTAEDVMSLRKALDARALQACTDTPLAQQFGSMWPDQQYLTAYADAMFVEFTWVICHFSGLLNNWFTLVRMHDERGRPKGVPDGWDDVYFPNFVDAYNSQVPDSIKVRNNNLLGADGFGS